MASSLPAAAPIVIIATSSSFSSQRQSGHHSKLCFHLSSKPKLLFSSKGLRTNWNRSFLTKAKSSKVPIDESSNAAPAPDTNSEVPALEGKDDVPANGLSPVASASEASIAEFMTQVASLVKLVDSRDIMELQLKQLDCELIIRKKEALPQQSVQAPVVMMQPPSLQSAMPSHFPPAQPAAPVTPAGPAPSSAPALVPPPAAKSTKSSLPPLKCPMAGTFYRSPGPGEPPFVKVGDKVKKGQVLCIIEAMKLMNEIEADQSGTVIEVLADDAKPVSVDTPLFVIEP